MTFHPAVLLLTWAGLALSLQWLSRNCLLAMLALVALLATLRAARRSRQLLWRTRWLLLSLLALFLFFTPGEYLPGVGGALGITQEGVGLAVEQLARLLALLLGLALLHEHLGNDGLLAGLYWLLGPFVWRESTVVRLMLVLEYVEKRTAATHWRRWFVPADEEVGAATHCSLTVQPLSRRDRLLLVMLTVALLAAWSLA